MSCQLRARCYSGALISEVRVGGLPYRQLSRDSRADTVKKGDNGQLLASGLGIVDARLPRRPPSDET